MPLLYINAVDYLGGIMMVTPLIVFSTSPYHLYQLIQGSRATDHPWKDGVHLNQDRHMKQPGLQCSTHHFTFKNVFMHS